MDNRLFVSLVKKAQRLQQHIVTDSWELGLIMKQMIETQAYQAHYKTWDAFIRATLGSSGSGPYMRKLARATEVMTFDEFRTMGVSRAAFVVVAPKSRLREFIKKAPTLSCRELLEQVRVANEEVRQQGEVKRDRRGRPLNRGPARVVSFVAGKAHSFRRSDVSLSLVLRLAMQLSESERIELSDRLLQTVQEVA